MKVVGNLLILLPARIASYFVWAGPLIMWLIVGYTFLLSAGASSTPWSRSRRTSWAGASLFPRS